LFILPFIQNELLKSVELTGIWEKKLRQIERGEYEVKVFLNEMRQMVTDLVLEVKKENT
jgi:DNA topoisomerase-3